jgi:DNA polymerase-3 subunit alpha
MEQTFTHLRLHTEYSLRDGLVTIPALIKKAKESGMKAVAITDLGNLYGTIKFYQEAIANQIKPLIGADLWVKTTDSNTPSRLTLFCQNQTGYKNLLKLVSLSYLEGRHGDQPVVQPAWLHAHHDGLIALVGETGDIGQAILDQDIAQATQLAEAWRALFQDRFYIEIHRVGKANEKIYLPAVLRLAETLKIPVVATNDVRFLEREDYEAHEARVCIQEGVTLNDAHRAHHYTDQQYFRTAEEMQSLFHDTPEALINAAEIVKRCNLMLELGKNQLPHFAVPAGYTTESYLCEAAQAGLEERLKHLFDPTAPDFANNRRVYDARLARELAVINEMGFAGYFLIVADFTRWAKQNDVPVGPGRGSGPGSLVAYALHITDLDPLALDLLFERFLNPERISMPDFDVDFCMDGRDRVIEYVMERHGHDCVSQIMTYGTMAAKAVVRDVGRVLGMGYGFVDKIAKLIPFELGMTLELALSQEPLLKERYENEEEVRTLIDLARKLEGIVRSVGTHAGGIVIAPGPLTDFLPVYCESDDATHPVTQFDKDDVEAVGLIKFDFLGLKTLTIIHQALKVINQKRVQENLPAIDIGKISHHDVETFSLLRTCHSTAVFQLESHGMRELIKRLEPDCFEDLIALVALFRPGPLQSGMVDDFINRKHGRAAVYYPHPKLEPILRPTYGVILYQEQVMQIAQVLAGYTLGAADILRRAMGKKKPEEMAKQREVFCTGAVKNGVEAHLAEHIFDLMEKFAGYGFNKSHSASYALIAYQTAWLKARYPAAFMAAVLSADMDKTDKLVNYLDECRHLKLTVLPPDVNQSEYRFHVIDDATIRYGLGAIKGVGESAIDNLVEARKKGGSFANLFDFCKRVDLHKVNRRVLEAFIKSGCFDTFGVPRSHLKASLDHALREAEQLLSNQLAGQHDLLSLFDVPTQPAYIAAEDWKDDVRLRGEKEALGLYLTGHPIHRHLPELAQFTTCRLGSLNPTTHSTARIAGLITRLRLRQTKRGDRMAVFTLDDGSAAIEAVCFSKNFQAYRHLILADQIVIVEGSIQLDEFNHQPRITVEEIYTLDDARNRFAKYLRIAVKETVDTFDPAQLETWLTPYLGGQCPVMLEMKQVEARVNIKLNQKWLIKPVEALVTALNTTQQLEAVYVYREGVSA